MKHNKKFNLKVLDLHLHTSYDVFRLMGCTKIRKDLGTSYLKLVRNLLNHEGKTNTLKVLKGYYLIATRVALESTYEPYPFRKSDKEGFPKDINIFKDYLVHPCYEYRKCALMILRSYLLIYDKPDKDTSTITDTGPDVRTLPWYGKWIYFLKHWSRKFKVPERQWGLNHMWGSTKAGPNGQATLYSHIDAISVLQDNEVAYNLKRFCTAFGIEPLWEYVTSLALNNVFPITKSLRTSKLSFLSEGGGKTRVIAIGDY